jgi:hypothetical protein
VSVVVIVIIRESKYTHNSFTQLSVPVAELLSFVTGQKSLPERIKLSSIIQMGTVEHSDSTIVASLV